jgi:hypothetical protein
MLQIPQSTARRVLLKLFLSSDHVTAATGKTVAVTLSKAGGAFANPSAGATTATELANGWYYVDLSTTDTATLGDLVVRGAATSCDDAERILGVVSAASGGLTNLDAAVSSRSAFDATAAMTESYAADGATFTLAQALYMIWALLAERSINSTTLTAKKLDGSTTAMTFALDSATAPASQTRAT